MFQSNNLKPSSDLKDPCTDISDFLITAVKELVSSGGNYRPRAGLLLLWFMEADDMNSTEDAKPAKNVRPRLQLLDIRR
jgi:hypothetical protein